MTAKTTHRNTEEVKRKLTSKQVAFVSYYVESGVATEAYIKAYKTSKMKRETINRNAFSLLHTSYIASAIEVEQKKLRIRAEISKGELLRHLENIVRSNIANYVEFDGNTVRFKAFSSLTPEQLEAIESIKEGKKGIELKLQGKSWSIERICKMLGYDEPEKKDITSDGQQIAIEIISDKSQANNEDDTDH